MSTISSCTNAVAAAAGATDESLRQESANPIFSSETKHTVLVTTASLFELNKWWQSVKNKSPYDMFVAERVHERQNTLRLRVRQEFQNESLKIEKAIALRRTLAEEEPAIYDCAKIADKLRVPLIAAFAYNLQLLQNKTPNSERTRVFTLYYHSG